MSDERHFARWAQCLPWLPYGVPHALLTDTAAAQFLLRNAAQRRFRDRLAGGGADDAQPDFVA